MTRKSPYRHHVRGHTREAHHVSDYMRGKGFKPREPTWAGVRQRDIESLVKPLGNPNSKTGKELNTRNDTNASEGKTVSEEKYDKYPIQHVLSPKGELVKGYYRYPVQNMLNGEYIYTASPQEQKKLTEAKPYYAPKPTQTFILMQKEGKIISTAERMAEATRKMGWGYIHVGE